MTLRLPRAELTVAPTTKLRLPSFPSSLSIALFLWLAPSVPAIGATFYVDGSNPACSDAGPGTESIPYCTINGAQAVHWGPGVTIAVKPGTYNEVVNITKAGAAGNPFVFQALGPGVIVNGRFSMSARPWVTIDGFTVEVTGGGTGIMVGSSSNAVITRNTVLHAANLSNYGIYASYASNLRIAGNTVAHCESHGIVIRTVTGSVIEDNAAHHNDHGFLFKVDNGPTTGNIIRRNRAWSNATTGFYYQSGVHGNLAVQNLAWSNGDHGIQHSNSRDNRHIGEVVWGNADDGVSIKDNSTGNSFFNCIVENNGIAASAYAILVDSTSTAGWSSDDNVIWNSSARMWRFGGTAYYNVQSFSLATGHDTRTRNQYAWLLDPANGDFRPMEDSPAIDCANAAITDWPATDFRGHAPVDDPDAANSGIGAVDHSDRGAFEFLPSGSPPTALLRSVPSTGPPAFDYVLDASASYDLDGPLLWYWFIFGDGVVVGPQSAPTIAHTYAPGTWKAKVIVADTSGRASIDSTTFTVGVTTGAPNLSATGLALGAMTPNPVHGAGRFQFVVPRSLPVRASVVDVQGRTVATLVDRVCEAGRHEASWDGATAHGQAPPGLYFVRLETPEARLSRRFLIAR